MRELLFSVTPKDCIKQTFRAGGKGGQNQNKRDTGVRWIHPPSGARGEARDQRSQLQNAKSAWKRMCESKAFRAWVAVQTGKDALLKAEVEQMLNPNTIKVEVKKNGQWVEE